MSTTYYPGDYVIGEAHKPGYRARQHLDQNVVEEYGVAAGQKIKMGDIITMNASKYASNFVTGTTASSYNTADLRNGMFQALNGVDNTNGSNGDELVTVVPPGGFAELYAAAGIEAGDFVEMDIKSDASPAAALTAQLPATTALTARSRVKAVALTDLESVIGSATTAGTATLLNPEAYGVVGWVRKIMNRDQDGDLKNTTAAGDIVMVELGRSR